MALTHLTVLYRGFLSSCNYGCPYCPFAKRTETLQEHRQDALALSRFVAWVEAQPFRVSVLFTPWGEALARPRYQQALVQLSHAPNTEQLAVQTNLSGRLGWLRAARREKIGLWATYHPGEVARERFLARCAELRALGVRHSVGMVGLPRHYAEIGEMRAALPPQTYLWVNAYDGRPGYSPAEVAALTRVDPLFAVSAAPLDSRGQPCAAGETAISVDGEGTVRRCHFIARPLGNLYADDLETILRPRPCSRPRCDCHIGYVHLERLEAGEVYGPGLLARIPEGPAWARPAAYLERARQLQGGSAPHRAAPTSGPQASATGR